MQSHSLTHTPSLRALTPTAAFYLQASLIVSFLAGSSAPTPLYASYQQAWGFSPITITVVFGIYAIAVLVALLTTGSLSDHLGRKPVLFGAIAMQSVAMIVFAIASGVPALIAARVLQGLATGAAASALGAGMLDIDRAKGTVANAVSPMLGVATGALGASLLVQYLPSPTVLVYIVLLGVFVAQAFGVALMAESIAPKPGALASLKPHVSLPPQARAAMLAIVPALVAVWSLFGFYGSLGPALARSIAHSHSSLLGGLALAVLAASGGAAVFAFGQADPGALQRRGGLALIAGVATILASIAFGSLALYFIGTIAAGAGFGVVFQGALRRVLPLARAHERAGLIAIVYVVCYASMGVPAVIAGIAVVSTGSITVAAYGYGCVVMALAAIALALIPRRA
ncbi:MAG TPA: MFS transporter [Kofleriaceae bacterium]|jgi:MFS family permease